VPTSDPGRRRDAAARALRRLTATVGARAVAPDRLEELADELEVLARQVEHAPRRDRDVRDLRARHLEVAVADGATHEHNPDCPACGRSNPFAVPLEVRRVGEVATTTAVLDERFACGGAVRAGVVAGVLDDLMGYVLVLQRRTAFTRSLRIVGRRPLPVGVEVTMSAWQVDERVRDVLLTGTAEVDGDPYVEASGSFRLARVF
jgi:hypothetical protein